MRDSGKAILWAVAIALFIGFAPLTLTVNEGKAELEPTALHYVKLKQRSTLEGVQDTLFGIDSMDVDIHFQAGQDLDWIHWVAPTFTGGDSAGLATGILVYYSNDGTTWYAATVAAHDTILAGVTSATDYSTVLATVPLLKALRLRLVSTADNDTTIVGGYYIYR